MIARFKANAASRSSQAEGRRQSAQANPNTDDAMSQTAHDNQPRFDDESGLIDRAAGGDMAAFRLLYDGYVHYVSHHVGRLMGPGYELEDVVQEVFVQVFRSLGEFRHESKFSTWLYRLSRNVAIDHLRKRAKTVDLSSWRPLKANAGEWNKLEARELVRALYAAMQKFSVENREAFVLYEIEGMTLREIEELTGESINTIAARVRRTREQLRGILEATHKGGSL
ncbi:MAG: sigma-70 family RNA polymerase sigma factor [Bradymonadaceae bacterium]|nr:sigma-70 family RNA polymerase sigma factor [Lujinxingiaceae bacterium]